MATLPDNTAGALSGARVLICRPEPEASRLARAFEAVGAAARVLPAIERVPLPETPEARQIILNLDQYQHVVAVSPYATRQLLDRIDNWWPQLPAGIRWYGVGSGTAAAMAEAGLDADHPPAGFTSEALLEQPARQQLNHQKVLLARGEQGRELLRETLEARGAQVTVLPLYRRQLPEHSSDLVTACLDRFQPDVVIALSGETLNNFIALSENSGHNCHDSLLLVPVDRIAQTAREAGFNRVVCASGMADGEIVDQVTRCYSHHQADARSHPDRPDRQ